MIESVGGSMAPELSWVVADFDPVRFNTTLSNWVAPARRAMEGYTIAQARGDGFTIEDVIRDLCNQVTRWQHSADFWRDESRKMHEEVMRARGARPTNPWAWYTTSGAERTWRRGVWA